jgi:hypothetical protein
MARALGVLLGHLTAPARGHADDVPGIGFAPDEARHAAVRPVGAGRVVARTGDGVLVGRDLSPVRGYADMVAGDGVAPDVAVAAGVGTVGQERDLGVDGTEIVIEEKVALADPSVGTGNLDLAADGIAFEGFDFVASSTSLTTSESGSDVSWTSASRFITASGAAMADVERTATVANTATAAKRVGVMAWSFQ